MVDPRIYRAGLALVVVAVIVFGFSLQNGPAPMSAQLAPGQLFGSGAQRLATLAARYPVRRPGSSADDRLADYVASQLRATHGFTVASQTFSARTAGGTQALRTVTAERTGLSGGTIVVVSHRDAAGGDTATDLSGTVVLLELADALAGANLNRSVMLVSTSGQVGAAGAARLASELRGQPVDAVITLGDLAAAHARRPVVVPWSSTAVQAPAQLQDTLAAAVSQQAGIHATAPDLASQFAHLALPFAVTEQAPLDAAGVPAVQLSLSGDRLATPGSTVDAARMAGLADAVLQSVEALETGPAVPAPSPYLTLSGKIVPEWAVRLLVLGLILPVLGPTVDAVARARRRGHSLRRWIGWVLAGAVPFLVGLVALVLARLTTALPAPAGAVGSGIGIGVRGALVMVVVAALVVAALHWLRPLCVRFASQLGGGSAAARRAASPAIDGAAVALNVVIGALAVILWLLNPFAAVLLVPALHLWLWLAEPGVQARRPVLMALILGGIVLPALVAVYYAESLAVGPLGLLWSGVLFVAGGGVSGTVALLWCVALGALVSALVLALRVAPASRAAAGEAESPVSVRGPATYAGPGSLGGTESALRR